MSAFLKDLSFAARALTRSPTFTVAAILSLALGIGANTTIFTFVNALLLRPLPVEEPERLAVVYSTLENNPRKFGLSHPNYLDLRDSLEVFSGLQIHSMFTTVLRGDPPERVRGHLVSGNYFDVLGVNAALGRTFLPEEDLTPGTHPVVVLSHSLWQRRFAADPGILGSSIDLAGQELEVIGIAPESFRNLGTTASPDLWAPMMSHPFLFEAADGETLMRRDYLRYTAVGRLAPGIDFAQANAAVELAGDRLRAAFPKDNEDLGNIVEPLEEVALGADRRAELINTSRILLVIVALVLIIACANVANLLMVRTVLRRRDTGLRIALGAKRWELARLMLCESFLLTLVGGGLGLALAIWGRNALWKFRPPRIPADLDLSIDVRVLLFTFLLALVTGVVFSLIGILQAGKVDVVSALKDRSGLWGQGSRRGIPVRQILLAVQVAFTVVALVGAGLFIASLQNSRDIDTGFDVDNIFILSFNVADQDYDPVAGEDFFNRLVERVEALPQVENASIANRWAFGRDRSMAPVTLEGRALPPELEGVLLRSNRVLPGYFQTLGIPLLRGRDFASSDNQSGVQVAIINQAMAEMYWQGEDALGQRFILDRSEPLEVVGIVGNAMYNDLNEELQPYIYRPISQQYSPGATLHVRTTGNPESAIEPVRQQLFGLDDKLPSRSRTMFDVVDRVLWASRLGAGLLSLFGLLAILLAAIGIYGVVSYMVNSSRRETGIRLAIGAQRRSVLLGVLGVGSRWVLLGLVLGLTACYLAYPQVETMLYEIGFGDRMWLFAKVALVMMAVGVLACLFPALRSTWVDPVKELRSE